MKPKNVKPAPAAAGAPPWTGTSARALLEQGLRWSFVPAPGAQWPGEIRLGGPASVVAEARSEVRRRAEVLRAQHATRGPVPPHRAPRLLLVPGLEVPRHGACESCGQPLAPSVGGDCALCTMARVLALRAGG